MTSHLLLEKIIKLIEQAPQQKITFAQYMDLCLYDREYGYYNSPQINIGKTGDFSTSTSLSNDFGELVAIQIEEFWQILGKPKPFSLVEIGAGEGTLALSILNFLHHYQPEILDSLEYIIIEKSSSLTNKQQELLLNNLPVETKIKWSTLEDLENESIVGCFFSNEFFDALPVHLVTWHNSQLQEIYVTYEQGKLSENKGNLSTDNIDDYFRLCKIEFSDVYPDQYQTEVNLLALNYLSTIAQKLQRGYILTIDYGYSADKYYHPQRCQGSLKCYYQHRHHHDPYVNIGTQDITSHVNFTALQNYGESLGLSNIALTYQALFLMGLGLGDRLHQLSAGNIPANQIILRRNQLHSLINPQGLGKFQVLLQGKNIDLREHKSCLRGFNHDNQSKKS